MLKKILTYILSLTLMTSSCCALEKNSILNQKNDFITNQIDKSYSLQEDDTFFEDFEEEVLFNTNTEEESKITKLGWILGSSIPTILNLVIDAPLVSVKDNKIEKLIGKLEKSGIRVMESNISCVIMTLLIKGLGYIEGRLRNTSANKDLLFKLGKNLVFLTAYDFIAVFFHLDVCQTESLKDLLKLSHSVGDDMVSENGYDEEFINDKIKESNLYIEKIKEKFNNLSISETFDKLDLYSEETTNNKIMKDNLLCFLKIINMKSEKFENLMKNIINDLL